MGGSVTYAGVRRWEGAVVLRRFARTARCHGTDGWSLVGGQALPNHLAFSLTSLTPVGSKEWPEDTMPAFSGDHIAL